MKTIRCMVFVDQKEDNKDKWEWWLLPIIPQSIKIVSDHEYSSRHSAGRGACNCARRFGLKLIRPFVWLVDDMKKEKVQ